MAKRIGDVSVVLTANTIGFSRGLQDASSQLTNFGRHISSSFSDQLTGFSLGPIEGTLQRMPGHAAKAERALVSMAATRQSIQALQGTLLLATGQTGFFAVEALRAANSMATFVRSSGGLGGALSAIVSSATAALSALGPVGASLIGIGAAAAAAASAMRLFNQESKEAAEIAKQGLPIFEREANARRAIALERGDISKFDSARMNEESRLGRGIMRHEEDSLRKAMIMEEDLAAIRRGKEADKEYEQRQIRRIEAFKQSAMQAEEQNRKIIADRAQRETDLEWERAIALDKLHEEMAKREEQRQDKLRQMGQNLLIEMGAAKASDFETDPAIKRLLKARESLEDASGKDTSFGISSRSFIGGAPVGDLIGEQRVEQKQVELLSRGNELTEQLIREVKDIAGVEIN